MKTTEPRYEVDGGLGGLKRKLEDYEGPHNEWSSAYFESHQEYYRGISELVEEYLDGPLLEVGSAPYHLSSILQEKGYEITGLDLEPDRMNGLINSLGLDIKQCDIEQERFPLDDGSVLGVVFTEVLEHLRINPIHTLEEINRVLEPDGRVLLTTPNLTSIYNINSYLRDGKITDPYDEFAKLREVGHMGHVREYTASEVQSLLEKTGYEIVHQGYANWPNKNIRGRSLLHNIGLFFSHIIPRLRKFQIHVAKV